jgi:undecaprenyl-diphosphatase
VAIPPLLKAAILGGVQGITEFLPVSSTAHLIIGGRLLAYDDPGGVFTVMIQLGSIFAVMWLYRGKIIEVVAGLPSRPDARRFALMIVLATVPALVAGALLSEFVKGVLYASFTVIALAFILGGIVMLIVERFRPAPDVRDVDHVPVGRAFGVGCFQTLALIPGVSRSGGTIVGAMLLGIDRPAAAEFSFFLAMPTMAAAFVHDLLKVRHDLGPERGLEIAVGFVMAFIASAAVVKPFLNHVKRRGFGPFAWYRILAGLVLLAAIAAGWSEAPHAVAAP